MKKRLGLFTAFTAIVVAAMLFVSCGQNSAITGSISLNASELTRQLMSRDVAEGDGTSVPLTYEGFRALLEQELQKVMDKHFAANVSLTLSGDYNGTGTQQITPSMFAKSDHHAASGENGDEEDDVKIELKRIPVGSTVEVLVELSFAIDNQYESEMNKAIENLLASYPEFSGMKESLMYEMNYVFSADRYRKLKYEGKTAEPVTIKAGKNSVTIEMEQTDGFYAGGAFTIELEDSEPLEIMVANKYEDNEIVITPVDSMYEFVRVEYSPNPEYTSMGDWAGVVDLENPTCTAGMNSSYMIIFDEDEIILTANDEYEDPAPVSSFFSGRNSLFIIAKHSYTGKYKTVVYKGL
ncbi:MAG: hypothetical protein J5726_02360 [Treponema sp.]|nr:hypothetical protein [Treponema sp.]